MIPTRAILALSLATFAGAALTGCQHRQKGTVIIRADNDRLNRAIALAQEAQDAQKAGKNDRAIDLYRKSLEQSQELFGVWNNLGMLLMKKGENMEAAEMFKAAADLAPSDPRPYYNIGLIYQGRQYPVKALEFYEKALARDPRYLPALRGAIRVGQIRVLTDEPALERIRTGLLIETDPTWIRLFQTELFRIEAAQDSTPSIGRLEPATPNR
ncbi:MAG: tetratricopeptide repeat protein [Phycisphaerales bacterium]